MSPAALHLAINHLPVLWPPVAAALLAAGLARGSGDLARAGLVLLLAAGLAGPLVYWSGSSASDLVLDLPDVTPGRVSEHAHAAWTTLVAGLLAAAAAAGTLAASRSGPAVARVPLALALVLALFCSAAAGWTAHRGGQIRHAEIR